MSGNNYLLDTNIILYLLETHLRQAGFQPVTANSAKQALGILQQQAIDLLITDLIMPEMGGFEAFNKIRELDPEARIILASGYSMSEDVVELLSTGGVEFLQKPFGPEEMLRKINAALGATP